MICQVNGCEGWVFARGLCGRHYQQARRHPERSQFMPLSFMQILLAKFPVFDPAWSPAVKQAWFSTMAKMKGADE